MGNPNRKKRRRTRKRERAKARATRFKRNVDDAIVRLEAFAGAEAFALRLQTYLQCLRAQFPDRHIALIPLSDGRGYQVKVPGRGSTYLIEQTVRR